MVQANNLSLLERFASPAARKDSIEEAFVSRYWELIYIERDSLPASLNVALVTRLPHIPENEWPERFAWGGVFVNGQEAHGDAALPFPCRIEYYEPRFDFRNPHSFFPRFALQWIVYQDEHLVCAFKPDRLPTLPAREQKRYCLKCYLEDYLGTKVHMPSRLDMSTCGLVLASCAEGAHQKLQRLFETRSVTKTYLLESAQSPGFEEKLAQDMIGKDPAHPILRRPVDKNGKAAQTHFKVLGPSTFNDGQGTAIPSTIIQAQPRTGRTHQIRVHSLYNGFPIIGDQFYGGYPAESLHLVSAHLRFPHPITRREVVIGLPEGLVPGWARRMSSTVLT